MSGFFKFDSKSFVVSSHDISDGGLAIALAECCIFPQKGHHKLQDFNRDDNLLFGEGVLNNFSIDKTKKKNGKYLKEIK